MSFKVEVTVVQKINPYIAPLWNKVHLGLDGDKTDLLNLQQQLELVKSDVNQDVTEDLKQDFISKRQSAEEAAYKYCCSCEIGEEREQAFEIYERIRNATRIHSQH